MKYLLFGIGRNAIGRTAFPCARRAIFVRFPGDWYTEWYSWCPVAMETVILSLPEIIGTSMDPCVRLSSEIVSWQNNQYRDSLQIILQLIIHSAPLHSMASLKTLDWTRHDHLHD